jgi:proteasome lid subunit RPN8/RPN11
MEMALVIDPAHIDGIRRLAEQSYPDECCGFLLGKAGAADKTVRSAHHVDNEREAEERYHRFLITPDVYKEVDQMAREKKLDIIGFFHSHPDAPARPSQYDLEHAWPWLSYVIISVDNGEAGELTSWVLTDDRSEFSRENMISK